MSHPPPPSPAAAEHGEPSAVVAGEIPTPVGPVLRGQRRGDGPHRAILVHEPGTDLDAWGALPSLLAAADLTVVAVDLPGHGLSDDPWRPELLAPTLGALVAHARAEGAASVCLVAAGAGATAALELAVDGGLDALVALSPAEPTSHDDFRFRAAGFPKLVLVGALDPSALATARSFVARCVGWTVLSTIPTAEQGTRLLAGPWGRQVGEQIATFLRDYRRPHPALAARLRPPTEHAGPPALRREG